MLLSYWQWLGCFCVYFPIPCTNGYICHVTRHARLALNILFSGCTTLHSVSWVNNMPWCLPCPRAADEQTTSLFPSLDTFEYVGYESFVCQFFDYIFSFGSYISRSKIVHPRDGEKAQLLLQKDSRSISNTHMEVHRGPFPSPRGFVALFLPLNASGTYMLHRHTHQQNIHIHKVNKMTPNDILTHREQCLTPASLEKLFPVDGN